LDIKFREYTRPESNTPIKSDNTASSVSFKKQNMKTEE
jgi:hypothetical protein